MSAARKNSPRLMIIAGEASGDLHGANLVAELKKIIPELNCYGLGDEQMRKAGVDIHVNASELSIVGLIEVIRHYPRLRGILKKMRHLLKSSAPDLLVLIDSPDFNLRLAKTAKQYGTKVMYYISPQIWAWRSARIKTIKKCVDMMAVVFPFEVKFYKDAGIPVEYVGHPLLKDAVVTTSRDEFFSNEKLDLDKKLIGIFPGSRASEIENNFPILIKAASKLSQQRTDLQFITPIASTIEENFIDRFISHAAINITTTTARIYDVINACDAIAAASGTVTLQITLMQTPLLIVYKVSPLTYLILKRLVSFTFAGITNVIAGREICREFIQNKATPENIAHELEQLLSNQAYIEKMKREMADIREKLGAKDGSTAAARLAASLIASAGRRC